MGAEKGGIGDGEVFFENLRYRIGSRCSERW